VREELGVHLGKDAAGQGEDICRRDQKTIVICRENAGGRMVRRAESTRNSQKPSLLYLNGEILRQFGGGKRRSLNSTLA